MPIVSGKLFSESAYAYAGKGLTYRQYDCTHFTNLVRRTCSLSNLQQGSNAMWRGRGLTWKGTIQEARNKFGGVLPQGLYLFHVYPDDDPRADPDHYGYGDGIGDVNHVGIYTNIGLGVMQSGGYGGTGVHDSNLTSYFNLAGCATGIDYTGRTEPIYPNPCLYQSFWMSPTENFNSWASSEAEPDAMQYNNANCIKSKFVDDFGWTLQSVCGILGNMQIESTLNPAYISPINRSRLTDPAQLSNVMNYITMYFDGDYYSDPNTDNYGLGLCQWSQTSQTNGLTQSYIVAYSIVNHYNWFDGWYQCRRINSERANDSTTRRFDPNEVNGVRYTFANYAIATTSPADCAEAWAVGYQKTQSEISTRRDNAQFWYDYFTSPDAPEPVPEPDPLPYTLPPFPQWLLYTKKRKELFRPWVKM